MYDLYPHMHTDRHSHTHEYIYLHVHTTDTAHKYTYISNIIHTHAAVLVNVMVCAFVFCSEDTATEQWPDGEFNFAKQFQIVEENKVCWPCRRCTEMPEIQSRTWKGTWTESLACPSQHGVASSMCEFSHAVYLSIKIFSHLASFRCNSGKLQSTC